MEDKISEYTKNLEDLKSKFNFLDKKTEEMAWETPRSVPPLIPSPNSSFNIVKPTREILAEKDEKIKNLEAKIAMAETIDENNRRHIQMMSATSDYACKVRDEKIEQATSLLKEYQECLHTVLRVWEQSKNDNEIMTQKNTELKKEIQQLQMKIAAKKMEELQFNKENEKQMNSNPPCFSDHEILASCSMQN